MSAAVRPQTPAKRPQKLKKRGFLSLLRDIAGNATTETVIMIPLFVAIWGSIWYTHARYRKAINMAQYTRAHTWQYAFSGCEATPAGRTRVGARTTDSSGFIDGTLSMIFDAGLIPGFQFDEIEGQRDGQIQRPAVLGEGTVQMHDNLIMLCNEREADDRNLFELAWGVFF